jgi:hypothetical protein
MLPNISKPGDTLRTSPVKYFAELVTKMKKKYDISSGKKKLKYTLKNSSIIKIN